MAQTTQIALLRAVNLGANRRVAMADLRALASDLGFKDVKTILQSGNLVYRTELTPARAEAALEKALRARVGIETDVIVRTSAQWRAIVQRNPFPREADKDPSHLLVMACKKAPGASLTITGRKREVVHPSGKEIFIFYPDGLADTRLKFSATGTARNWNTVLKLLAATQQ